ncbi:MAG: hypothetical protein WA532_06280 [Candidatus Korobacteraceae bacterium]
MPESDFQQKNTEIRRSTISVNGCTPAYVYRYLTTTPAFVSFRIQAPAERPGLAAASFCRVTRKRQRPAAASFAALPGEARSWIRTAIALLRLK